VTFARAQRARNILVLVLLATAFAFRSGIAWRRWQRRHPARA
jgi:hypothetical protein